MRHQVELSGCTVEPMAAYLKAVAVFRLVSEQKDPTARGYWRGREFYLDSELDREALERFFLEEYRPTPIVAPWHGGSGFSEGDSRTGIDAILSSADPRFEHYRQTIAEIFSWPEFGGELILSQILANVQAAADLASGNTRSDLLNLIGDVKAVATNLEALLPLTTQQIRRVEQAAYKPVSKLLTKANRLRRSGDDDGSIVRRCRNTLPDSTVNWIDCAVVLRTSNRLEYPPIAGTGGNEGNLEYTNSFIERVSSLLLTKPEHSRKLLRNALYALPTDTLTLAAVGQLDPGRAGGYNQGPGIENKKFPTNYWTFVLAMEGAVIWAGSATRRQGIGTRSAFCSPFTVQPKAIGYGSAQKKDEEKAAEVWMPVWERPCRFEELQLLLREGRVEWRGKPVSNALEFAEAAASLGADRGIAGFERYSLVKRRGKSYLALPAGRIDVQLRSGVDLLEDVDRLTQRIDTFGRQYKQKHKSDPPTRFLSLRRQIDTTIYNFALRGGKERIQDILLALGRMECYFATRDLRLEPKLNSPLSGLNPQWLWMADDGSLEFRIAVALASIESTGDVGPVRANLTPVDAKKPLQWIEGSGQTAWLGSSLPHRMTSILKRRLMDAGRLNCKFLPLEAAVHLHPEDAASFLEADIVDENRIEDLLFACTLINWGGAATVTSELNAKWETPHRKSIIPSEYALLKHLFDPSFQKMTEPPVKPEPSILSLLTANRIDAACDIAIRRLRASRCAPIHASYGASGQNGARLAASLLIPIHSLSTLSERVLHQIKDKN